MLNKKNAETLKKLSGESLSNLITIGLLDVVSKLENISYEHQYRLEGLLEEVNRRVDERKENDNG